MFVGVFSNGWWSGAALPGQEVRVGLRSLEWCGGGVCRELSWGVIGGRGSFFGLFATVTYFVGILAAGLLLVGVYLKEFQGVDGLSKVARSACLVVLCTSVMTVFSFPGRISMSWGFWVTALGAIMGVASRFPGFGRSGWDGGEFLPIRVPRAVARTGDPYRSPAASEPEAAPVVESEAAHRMEYARKVAAANTHEAAERVGIGRLRQKVSAVKPAAVDSLVDTLRFVARTCQLDSGGLRAQLRRTDHVARLDQVERVVVRRLPADPPFARTIFVDIVLDGGNQVIRLLPSTHVNYAELPGAGTTSMENFRRLGAYLHEVRPGVLESESVGFFLEDKLPPTFQAVRQFADYDSQYAG